MALAEARQVSDRCLDAAFAQPGRVRVLTSQAQRPTPHVVEGAALVLVLAPPAVRGEKVVVERERGAPGSREERGEGRELVEPAVALDGDVAPGCRPRASSISCRSVATSSRRRSLKDDSGR